MIDSDDDLDRILQPPPVAVPMALRDGILEQTAKVVRRRRLVNRLSRAAALAAVFALGIGVGRQTVDSEAAPTIVPPAPEPTTIAVPVPVPFEVPSSAGPVVKNEPATAAAAELLAEQADDRREAGRLYRLAGDRFLNDAQDYRNAARCYRLFLSRAGEPALQPEPEDTWLLTSIKNALFKEKVHVAKTDG